MAKFDFVTPDGHKPMREIRSELLQPSAWNGPKFTENEVDAIIELFWFRDAHAAFISREEIYPKFLDFLKEKNNKSFRRVDFYSYLFSKHPLHQEILKLAYVFEKEMSDKISGKEYEKLEKKLSLHTSQLVAEHILYIEGDSVILAHHTISEYFVSQDLLTKKKPIEELQKLSIIEVPQTKEQYFNPSWYGVVYFLLDSDIAPELADFFTKLADTNKKIIDQNYSEILSHSNTDLLKPEQRKKLFNQIYSNSKESGIWISEWAVAGLVNLYSNETTDTLEKDLVDEPNEFPDILKTANVVAVMGALLEEKKITDATTRNRWKNIFIKYATQKIGNGVLQRRSLKALESFDDESIIDEVKSVFDFTNSGVLEQFVQEAFLRLCYEIAPNHPTTIEYVIRGFDSQARAYAWFGLQKITNLDSILKFLEKLSTDTKLLDLFLDDESIFLKNDEDEKEEKPFLQRIRELAKPEKLKEFLSIASDLIVEACDVQRYYYIQKKTFIPTVLETALEAKPDFWRELLSTEPGKKRNQDHFNLVQLLASVTDKNNYQSISFGVEELKPDLLDRYIYNIPLEEVRNKLIKKFSLAPLKTTNWEKEEANQKQKLIDDFNFKLEPAPKQYMTDIFDYYLKNKKEIGELTNKQRERLLFLSYEDGVKRLNPQDFSLKMNKYGDGKNFSWSKQAQFYGDMIRVVKELEPQLLDNCKQHLIDFIPFAFSDDASTIEEIVGEVNEDEIIHLNNVFSDKENDRRYLVPDSYTSFVKNMKNKGCNIVSPQTVLRSFIGDEKITNYEQRFALETLELFIDSDDSNYYEFLKEIEAGNNKNLSKVANKILIKKYKNQDSIQKRFSEIKKLAKPVLPKQSGVAYSVSFPEDEYMDKSYAWPLVEISDVSLTPQFLELLSFAEGFSKTENSQAYVEYVNSVVFGHFEKIASIDNYVELTKLERWLDSNYSIWWKHNFSKLQALFLRGIGKKSTENSKSSAGTDIASPESTEEIQSDVIERNFWTIVRNKNVEEIKKNLSIVELEIANELLLLTEEGLPSEKCSSLLNEKDPAQFSTILGSILFVNDKYVGWNSFRYLHPDFFIIETDKNDNNYRFCQFLYLLGIISNPEKESYYNGGYIFIEYTQMGKELMNKMQVGFLDKNAKYIYQISESFNSKGLGNTLNVNLPGKGNL